MDAQVNPAHAPPSGPAPHAGMPAPPRRRRGVLYPNLYVWFVFLATLDIVCTYMIMHPALFPDADPVVVEDNGDLLVVPIGRGEELNPLADQIIERWGVPGKVIYKFSLVLLVILICEIVGRARPATGRRLAEWAVALTAVPVAFAVMQMLTDRLVTPA